MLLLLQVVWFQGHPCEVQFHFASVLETKEFGHAAYDLKRMPTTNAANGGTTALQGLDTLFAGLYCENMETRSRTDPGWVVPLLHLE